MALSASDILGVLGDTDLGSLWKKLVEILG